MRALASSSSGTRSFHFNESSQQGSLELKTRICGRISLAKLRSVHIHACEETQLNFD
jgi:hypothetical protein